MNLKRIRSDQVGRSLDGSVKEYNKAGPLENISDESELHRRTEEI